MATLYNINANGTSYLLRVNTGSQGPKGDIGPQGPVGPQGPQGIQGLKGADGAKIVSTTFVEETTEGYKYKQEFDDGTSTEFIAPKGPKGDKGERGEKGDKGDKGDTGTTGAQGPKGADGAKIVGTELISSTDEGNTYRQNFDDGTTSEFLAPKGPKGDTGAEGKQGATGATGAKGDTGSSAGFGTPTATIDNNVGTPSVTVTASGEDTAKVFSFDFKNLKGDKGDQGPQGEQGIQGEKGDTPVKGTDYWNDADKAEINTYIDNAIGVVINGEY